MVYLVSALVNQVSAFAVAVAVAFVVAAAAAAAAILADYAAVLISAT